VNLEQKINDLLGRLAIISEAPAGNLEAQLSRSAPESSEPSGALSLAHHTDAKRGLSLFEWYRDEFAKRIAEPDRLLSLYLAGEREYLRRTDPRIHAATAEKGSIVAYSEDGATVEGIAAEHVIKEFEGVHALDVAIIEGKTEAWVLKVRRLHGRNPHDGRALAEFREWDDEERRRQIELYLVEVRSRGQQAGAKRIANHFGVSKQTIQRYLDSPAVAA
jgi:hypothetical protein